MTLNSINGVCMKKKVLALFTVLLFSLVSQAQNWNPGGGDHRRGGYPPPPPPRYEPRPGPGHGYPPGRPMPPPRTHQRVTGFVDSVTSDHRYVYVNGWACVTGYDPTIAVHLYVGGAAGQGTMIAQMQADQNAEYAVAQACQTYSSAHRFTFVIDRREAWHYRGWEVYVHGISPWGNGMENYALNQSGNFRIP